MAITRTSYPERVLIVFNADGTLKGAHVEHLEVLSDGADVLQAKQSPAVALNGDELAGLLPEQSALLAQVQALTDALTAANAERDAAVNASSSPAESGGLTPLSPVQLRLGLLNAGIRTSDILAVIDSISDDTERERAMAFWDYSLSYRREHPLIGTFSAALGLTSEQVDAMWISASRIN